jgi:hypothetical protein
MTAGGNWWRAYEIGCIQADYRHRQQNATVAVTMPLPGIIACSTSTSRGAGTGCRFAPSYDDNTRRAIAPTTSGNTLNA